MNLFQAIFTEQSESSLALLSENLLITYGDLRNQTLDMAAVLNLIEVAKGERVALLLNDSLEFVASFISTCSLGATAVPINMGLRVDEQRAILNDCTARVAIVEADLCSSLLTGARESLRELKTVLVLNRNEEQELVTEAQKQPAIEMASGPTWVAATIVSNRAVNGCRRWKLKGRCCDTKVSVKSPW